MRTYIDCIPCFVRQALDSVRMVTDDGAVHEQVLREVLRAASEMNMGQSPPAMGQRIHRLIRKLTGKSDPYHEMKERFTRLALDMLPDLERRVKRSADPMETAIRLAIAGNVIDFGMNGQLVEADVHQAVEHALTSPFDGNVEEFFGTVRRTENVLYLADNAGEIVFDRLLIEEILQHLSPDKVTLVVKGSPVINDATMADAQAAGITELMPVIDNGTDAPGTILEECSEAFQRRFEAADLVISKGQGNYETLSEAEKDVFFLLKAKCPVIARDIGCEVGSLVVRRSDRAVSASGKENHYARV